MRSPANSHRLSRPRRRAAWRRVRKRARLRARLRRIDGRGGIRASARAATRAKRPDRSTPRNRSPTTSSAARCTRSWTAPTAERILQLRVVDPAMGSAAFLVSACRYLARAYERALVAKSAIREADIDERDRAGFRRLIAQRCLFGVDLNPTAVQLARLVAVAGHAVGGQAADISRSSPRLRQQPAGRLAGRRCASASWRRTRRASASARIRRSSRMPISSRRSPEPSPSGAGLRKRSDDTADVVREKEKRLDRLRARGRLEVACRSLVRLLDVARPGHARPARPSSRRSPTRSPAGAPALPQRLRASLLDQVTRDRGARIISSTGCSSFPKRISMRRGGRWPTPASTPCSAIRPGTCCAPAAVEKHFFRSSGIYRHQGGGHINRYQIFVERALTLTRRGGRIGLVLPSGFATDHTSAPLRRAVADALERRHDHRLRQPQGDLSDSPERSLPDLHRPRSAHRPARSRAASASTTPSSSKRSRTPAIGRQLPRIPSR